MLECLRTLDRIERSITRYLPTQQETSDPSDGPAPTDFAEYHDDPVRFAAELFGLRLWSRQVEFLEAIAGHARIACRSGHKCGKSLAIAVAAWWFVLTRPDGRVLITAPTDRQVRRIVWREIRRLWRLARTRGYHLPEPAKAPDTGVQFDDDREIIGFSTDVPENMAGFSSPDALILVDEASGVGEAIFEAIQGNLAGGAKLVLVSNPTQVTGQFCDAFMKERELWHLLHMSSEEVANENSGPNRIRGLATVEWVNDRRRAWGSADARYQVRVAGNFQRASTNAVISLGLLEAAFARWDPEAAAEAAELRIGVDVARFGDDDSVVRGVRGLVALTAKQVHGYDTIEVAALVKAYILDNRQPGQRVSVRIDAGGGYGGGVRDQLVTWNKAGDLGPNVAIIEVSPSEAAIEPNRYYRRRDELWFGIRDWLEAGGMLDRDAEPDEVEEDLLAPTYSFARQSGTIKVEAKADIKRRLGRSCDHGDAFALAVVSVSRTARHDNSIPLDQPYRFSELNEDRWTDDAMGFG